MLQRLIVGILALTVTGAVGVGVYDAQQTETDPAGVLAPVTMNQAIGDAAPVALAVDPVAAPTGNAGGTQPQIAPTAEAVPAQTGPIQEQQALDMVGDPWAGMGTIVGFDTSGMTLALADGTSIYVELGPSHYWQSQDVTLAVGDVVTVDGFYNGEQYHAAAVTTADGGVLAVRDATGLPLWSGGANNGNGQGAGGQTDAALSAEPVEWITVEGTIALVNGSALTLQTRDGKALTLQLGQPRWAEEQGITFAAGDQVRVLGFWQDAQFKAGEILKVQTNERLMLLDPNGRPLWGGPGRNGAQSGQTAQGVQGGQGVGQGAGGQAQGGQGQGGGNGYQGGRNTNFRGGQGNQIGY